MTKEIFKAQIIPPRNQREGKHISTSHIPYTPSLLWNGTEFKGNDQLGKLCRAIDKQGVLHVYREQRIAYIVNDIKVRAEKSLMEDKKRGFKLVKYQPFEKEVFE